ncbi:ABC transporter substrate-binding protein [Paenarthrobacter sp. NCHU4564]|uniref:ABC transporter substrate-binding protein n=1 Tax=Paenarthrobacter sp. NCHU4564 TaxID=3451353 RepID=UPI003F9B2A59
MSVFSRVRLFRRTACVVTALSLVAAVTSCSPVSSGASESSDPGTGGWPLTMKHQFGETTISSKPERIVVTGTTDTDVLLALGEKPVAFPQWIKEWEHGVGPWSVDALGDSNPTLLQFGELDFEDIAAANPELILATGTQLSAEDYDKLNGLAPTLAPVAGYSDAYLVPWDTRAVQVGEAVGKKNQAEQLVSEAKAGFTSAMQAHPEWQGLTAVTVISMNGQFGVYAPTDNRGRFMDALGFKATDSAKDLVGGKFWAALSEERLDLLDSADVIVVLEGNTAAQEAFAKSSTFQRLAAVREGRIVEVKDQDTVMAMSASTVTSIPYALERLVPAIEKAVKD